MPSKDITDKIPPGIVFHQQGFPAPSVSFFMCALASSNAQPETAIESVLAHSRKALLVLGMHRSGTSALTRTIGLCGATLPRSPGIHESNPLGHWEPLRIVEAHDRFLVEAGTGWDDILAYPASMFQSELAASYRRRLLTIVRKEYGESPLFVLKDPRTSRLMPLWRPILAELGADPYIVISIRNPLEIADSMRHRDRWSEARTIMVWMRYMLSAERDTRDLPRCFVSYTRLLSDWRSVMSSISRELGVAFPHRGAADDARIGGLLRQDLQHHRRPVEELLSRYDIADCVKRVYRSFLVASETGRIDTVELDAITDALAEAEQDLEHIRSSDGPPPTPGYTLDAAGSGKRDALFALVSADLGAARNSADRSRHELATMRASRSWRWTKLLRSITRWLHEAVRDAGALSPARLSAYRKRQTPNPAASTTSSTDPIALT